MSVLLFVFVLTQALLLTRISGLSDLLAGSLLLLWELLPDVFPRELAIQRAELAHNVDNLGHFGSDLCA